MKFVVVLWEKPFAGAFRKKTEHNYIHINCYVSSYTDWTCGTLKAQWIHSRLFWRQGTEIQLAQQSPHWDLLNSRGPARPWILYCHWSVVYCQAQYCRSGWSSPWQQGFFASTHYIAEEERVQRHWAVRINWCLTWFNKNTPRLAWEPLPNLDSRILSNRVGWDSGTSAWAVCKPLHTQPRSWCGSQQGKSACRPSPTNSE